MLKTLQGYDFTPDQRKEIKEGIEGGVDATVYAKPEYMAIQMRQIKLGLMEGLDVSVYADPAYDWFQMEQLRKGLGYGIDVSAYASPDIPYDKMRQVRKGLHFDIDISPYLSYSAGILKEIRRAKRDGVDIMPYVTGDFDDEQLKQIRLALVHGINLEPFLESGFRGVALEEIRLGLENGVDVRMYAKPEYNWMKMREIRLGLEKQIDVTLYANALFTHRQMREIRLGLEIGLPVDSYRSLKYSTTDMRERRLQLMEEMRESEGEYRSLGGEASSEALESAPGRQTEQPVTQDAVSPQSLSQPRKEQPQAPQSAPQPQKAEPVPQQPVSQEPVTEVLKAAPQTQDAKEELNQDPYELVFTPDNMAVYLVRRESPVPLTEEMILSSLWANKIRKGILRKVIAAIAKGVNTDRNVLVASGQPPRAGDDGWYEFFIRIDIDRKPRVLEDGSVDYQNVEWFETVSEGSRLAYYHSAEEGEDGFTVRGDILKARRGKEKSVLRGFGFNLQDDKKTYLSAVDGWANYYNGRLEVSSMLEVEETSMATGNIVFNGSVHVKGNVGSQTEIHAKGDILVDGFVESAVLESGGSIVLRQGMNAAGQGSVTAAGDVVARFFESTNIQAGGKIEANYCMNCELQSDDVIQINGNLVGGRAYAVKGINVQNLGNRAAVTTYVKVGINDTLLEAHKKISDTERGILEELVMLGNALTEFDKKYPPEVKSGMEGYVKLKQAIRTKEEEQREIAAKKREITEELKQVAEGRILVNGRVYEGVLAEVNGKRWISRFMMNITIRRTADDKIAVYKN